jgi:hypothetical protein
MSFSFVISPLEDLQEVEAIISFVKLLKLKILKSLKIDDIHLQGAKPNAVIRDRHWARGILFSLSGFHRAKLALPYQEMDKCFSLQFSKNLIFTFICNLHSSNLFHKTFNLRHLLFRSSHFISFHCRSH